MTSPGRNFEPVVVKAAVLAIGVVVVRTLDDAFIHPAAGLGAGDHLLSGLVPVAAGVTAAAVILRTRGRLRSFAALLAGFWGLVASMELFIESGPSTQACSRTTSARSRPSLPEPSWSVPSASSPARPGAGVATG